MEKRAAGEQCSYPIGGNQCVSGVCNQRFFAWQIIFWFPALFSKFEVLFCKL